MKITKLRNRTTVASFSTVTAGEENWFLSITGGGSAAYFMGVLGGRKMCRVWKLLEGKHFMYTEVVGREENGNDCFKWMMKKI